MQQQIPTDSELEVLQIIWAHGAQTVRFVNDEQNKKRDVGYTTTLKIMQIMLDKGLLTRDIVERSHIYSAAVAQNDTQSQLLREFVDATFKGDSVSLVMRALGEGSTSPEDLAQIKALIADIEKGQNKF